MNERTHYNTKVPTGPPTDGGTAHRGYALGKRRYRFGMLLGLAFSTSHDVGGSKAGKVSENGAAFLVSRTPMCIHALRTVKRAWFTGLCTARPSGSKSDNISTKGCFRIYNAIRIFGCILFFERKSDAATGRESKFFSFPAFFLWYDGFNSGSGMCRCSKNCQC